VYRDLAIFSGNAHRELAESVCSYLGVELGRADVFEFTNENIFVRINQNVREHDVFIIQPTCAPVNKSLMELFIMLDALKRASARRVTAVIPYFSYGRSDKKDQPRVPITARLLADLILAAGADRVLTIDLHAGQIQGFFKIPVDELTAVYLLCDYFRGLGIDDPVVVSADIGFAKKARNFAELLHAPLAIVEKRREVYDASVESLRLIGDVRGKTALIVDDEVDTARSLVGAIQVCHEYGADKVYASAVHSVLSDMAVQRLAEAKLEEFVTTDTIPITPERRIAQTRVISVSVLLGEAISRIHTGGSVGALFGAAV
jgi:ribose-phosphate pyrophosphokinase